MTIFDQWYVWVGGAALVAMFGGVAGYWARRRIGERAIQGAEYHASHLLEEADRVAESVRRESEITAHERLIEMRTQFDDETRDRREDLTSLEKRLVQKEESLDRKVDVLDKKEHIMQEQGTDLAEREASVKTRDEELTVLVQQEKECLQELAGLSVDDAKSRLLERMKDEVQAEAGLLIKEIEDEAREDGERRARNLISLAIQRYAGEHTIETTVSVVVLPSDEMKGRIIGREGRNIRAFETATGVDVVIDDTPEAVTLSAFDTVRREIARVALERLVADGRIHPARIEEVVQKVRRETESSIQEEGERVIMELGITGIHPELVRLLGRLRYRSSYGQNVLKHLQECAYLMNVMAGELGLDATLARRCGLMHDIGKAVSHEVEGPHAIIGGELARKYDEPEEVIHAIEAHHEDVEQRSVYAVLTQAVDSISASRPGARRETLENYVRRLGKLEEIANSFKGVDSTFAIQAGREVRVIVNPKEVNDREIIALARDISRRIQGSLEYPGRIKVTIIRETRAVEYAK